MYRTLFLSSLTVACFFAANAAGQPKEAPGYWKFEEIVRVEYPKEKVHKVYPVEYTFDGNKLTAVAQALDGNNPKVVLTEEHQAWSWTPPPVIMVPGEKVSMKLELKLERTKFTKPPGFYIGGGVNAGFLSPKPVGAAAFHTGNDLRTEKGGSGALSPRDGDQGGLTFAPGTYTRESFYIVPSRQNRFTNKELPDRISFRVGGVIGNTREFNTIYEYKWVEGNPPTNRSGLAGETPKDKPQTGGKWEYKVVDVPLAEVFGDQLLKKLTELGNDGWELVSIAVPTNVAPASARLVFKRSKS